MDYKEKYEQALAKAKEQYNYPCMRSCMGILEEIFPELKESEDEKIRKELIKETKGSEVRLFETVTNDEFVAWLENIPVTIDHEKREGFHLGYKAGFEKQGNPVLSNSSNIGKDEQKPAWGEEDKNVLEDIEEAIINYWHGDTQDILLDWLKSLRPQSNKDAFIDKACEWLKNNVYYYASTTVYSTEVNIELVDFIEDFKEYMRHEQINPSRS